MGHLPKNLNDVVLIHSDPAGDVVVWNFLLNSFYLMMFRLLAGLHGFTTTKARRCLKIVLLLELELALRHDNHVELYFKMMILQTLKFHTTYSQSKVPSSHILSRFPQVTYSQGSLKVHSQGSLKVHSQGSLRLHSQAFQLKLEAVNSELNLSSMNFEVNSQVNLSSRNFEVNSLTVYSQGLSKVNLSRYSQGTLKGSQK